MRSYPLINCMTGHLVSVENHLRAYAEDGDSERLHLLRVDIKKIKAVLSFLKSLHKKKYAVNELRSLFHEAGAVRETEICYVSLVAVPGLPERLILRLQKEKKKSRDQFEKNIPGYFLSVSDMKQRIPLPGETVHQRSIIKYFKTEIHSVNKKIPNANRKDVHHLRMRLKDIMYLYEALPGKIQNALKLNTAQMDKLLKKAGDWHDRFTIINFLSRQPEAAKMANYIYGLKENEKKEFKGLVKKLNKSDIRAN